MTDIPKIIRCDIWVVISGPKGLSLWESVDKERSAIAILYDLRKNNDEVIASWIEVVYENGETEAVGYNWSA